MQTTISTISTINRKTAMLAAHFELVLAQTKFDLAAENHRTELLMPIIETILIAQRNYDSALDAYEAAD